MLRADNLAGVPHAFSTCVPLGIDDLAAGAPLVLGRQVHSAKVATVTGPWDGPPLEVDALVTATPALLIGVVTADCAPVLFADTTAGVVGAAHAGWRGAVCGVLANTVTAMIKLGAERARIRAAVGPTIAQASYEVDAAMRDRFPPDAHRFFAAGAAGRWQFDLPGFVTAQLREAGVSNIEDMHDDTYAQPHRFFSFRRATHLGQPTGGRQTSVIGLP